ncbi:alpha/beta hydrolase [Kineobactrum salinum]|uniref:alpha/beta hydrolase n=1 Tax=Kineobactrum salinum TaxID=2708301 RepID=UPI0018D637D3|nr:alpha/beta hydrolase [Kineobactrum salinum]
MNANLLSLLKQATRNAGVEVDEHYAGVARIFELRPLQAAPGDRSVILDLHGGGLIYCGGELCRLMGIGLASRLERRVWSVDYRMPPDHPYPAALDDGMQAYGALLKESLPSEIIISGASAGGNLAAALVLRIRDSGLPMPAGVYLNTPEIDLTESGDSFHTNLGVDRSLASLMPVNRLYANGHDLRHPYLSPLFGDFGRGFPPTVLTTGTRDLYLSNTVRMHRALRAADIPAELHVVEAGVHGGFPAGTPEGDAIDRDVRRFIEAALNGVHDLADS